MSRSRLSPEDRKWLHATFRRYQRNRPNVAVQLRILSDHLYELGLIFESAVLRVLGQDRIRKQFVRMEMNISECVEDPGAPIVWLLVTPRQFVEPNGLVAELASESRSLCVAIPDWLEPWDDLNALQPVLDSPHMASVEFFEISAAKYRWRLAKMIAEADTLNSLTGLRLRGNPIGVRGTELLAEAPSLSHLKWLDLSSSRTGIRGCRAIANSQVLQNLKSLLLEDNRIKDPGLQALAESSTLSQLVHLELAWNQITRTGFQDLQQATGLSSLVTLNLIGNEFSDQEALSLIGQPNFPQLNRVHSTRMV